MLVSLNVYDVTNTTNENTNGMITRLNSITRELNFGGVFHGAIQIDDVEWSFGYCESGTGVYCCLARKNSQYTFREHIELGETSKTRQEIRAILTHFKRTWPGLSYDLLQRNCCHFCDELCATLDVPRPPAWLNRFAQGADATVKFTNEASALAKRVSSNLSATAQQGASWLRDLSQRVLSQISVNTDSLTSDSGDELGRSSTCAEQDGNSDAAAGHVQLSNRGEASTSGASRLADKFRMLGAVVTTSGSSWGGLGAGGGASGSFDETPSGLPSSTHASTSDLASQQTSSQTLSLPSALRQKWQELETTAGDGTKQFLFGLIRTRHTRLDEDDDEGFSGSAGDRPGGSADTTPAAYYGAPHPSSTTADTHVPPTQAPPSQLIVHPLLPADAQGPRANDPSSQTVPSAVTVGPAASWDRDRQSTPHLLDM